MDWFINFITPLNHELQRTYLWSHCYNEKFSVILYKILGGASATFGRASENQGLLALPDY